jgi:hypothetical protein
VEGRHLFKDFTCSTQNKPCEEIGLKIGGGI